jgi:hypothetical protein
MLLAAAVPLGPGRAQTGASVWGDDGVSHPIHEAVLQ